MSTGYFHYPIPVNEPVLNYASGSAERADLKSALTQLKSHQTGYTDVHRFAGG